MKLITADWHIRGTVPRCVEATPEEWMEIQKKALEKIEQIAVENHVDEIYIGGDLFHSLAATTNECIYIVQMFCKRMYDEHHIVVRIMAGNHDLPNHSSTNIPKSPIGVLLNSFAVFNMADENSRIKGCNFDEDNYGDAEMIFKHTLTIPKKDIPFADIQCETPESLLEKYPNAKWIFTGDYHKHFEHNNLEGRHVINPGCLTKQASDFEDYETGVYVIDIEKEIVKWCPVNVEQEFNHNGETKKELDAAIENFVTGIKKESVTLDFIESVKKELPNHEKEVQDKVNYWIEETGL